VPGASVRTSRVARRDLDRARALLEDAAVGDEAEKRVVDDDRGRAPEGTAEPQIDLAAVLPAAARA
jgi:hypothetical protein